VRETLNLFASFYREPRFTAEVMEKLQLTEKADAWVGKLSADKTTLGGSNGIGRKSQSVVSG